MQNSLSYNKEKQRGFAVIELIVAIVVLVLVAMGVITVQQSTQIKPEEVAKEIEESLTGTPQPVLTPVLTSITTPLVSPTTAPTVVVPTPTPAPLALTKDKYLPLNFGETELGQITKDDFKNPHATAGHIDAYYFTIPTYLDSFDNVEVLFTSCNNNRGVDCKAFSSFTEIMYVLDDSPQPIPGQYRFNTRLDLSEMSLQKGKTYYLLIGTENNTSQGYYTISFYKTAFDLEFQELSFGQEKYGELTKEDLKNPYSTRGNVDSYKVVLPDYIPHQWGPNFLEDYQSVEVLFTSCANATDTECPAYSSFTEITYIFDSKMRPMPVQSRYNTRLDFDSIPITGDKTYYVFAGTDDSVPERFGHHKIRLHFDFPFKEISVGESIDGQIERIDAKNPFVKDGKGRVDGYKITVPELDDYKGLEVLFTSCQVASPNKCLAFSSFNEISYVLEDALLPRSGQYRYNTRLDLYEYPKYPRTEGGDTYYFIVGAETEDSYGPYRISFHKTSQ